MKRRHWIYTIATVAAVGIATYAVLDLSGDPSPNESKTESATTAQEPGGRAVEGAPTVVPDMPVPETPAETATPGATPSWRMNPSGETQPAGTNETPVEGTTEPAGAQTR